MALHLPYCSFAKFERLVEHNEKKDTTEDADDENCDMSAIHKFLTNKSFTKRQSENGIMEKYVLARVYLEEPTLTLNSPSSYH